MTTQLDATLPETRLPMPVRTALLRLTQGALANVLRHAHADRAGIELATLHTGGRAWARLRIRDDGVGFVPTASAGRGSVGAVDSFGLRAARERVDQLGGTLEVASAPGAGTTLTVLLPLPEAP